MKPYYERDGITIYHGDCRDILPTLEAESIDLVLTSPPYNCRKRYTDYVDDLPDEEFWKLNAIWLSEAYRMATETARLYAVVSDDMLWHRRHLAEDPGWRWAQLLVWCKPNFAGGTSRMAGDWNNMTEWIMEFRKGKRTPMMNGEGNTHNFFVLPSPQSNWECEPKEHIAQWPIELPRRIISRTPGNTVLDPFMGSGTTARACKDLGRAFIGCEVSEVDCEIAVRRLSQEVLAL